jgi:hypothetical protein
MPFGASQYQPGSVPAGAVVVCGLAKRGGAAKRSEERTMIRMGPLAFALAGYALLCGPAAPQGMPPENEDSRFSFFHTDDGYLRLDGRTGQVSLCTRRPAGWLCQALPEERAAFEAEIARLQGDNAALKKEVLAHDLPLPGGVRPDPAATADPRSPASTDRDGHQIVSALENAWRRLVALIVSVQRDLLKKS